MSIRHDWVPLIRSYALRYGVDPRAALAVASSEGLSGLVGDNGTSFGPFQLHIGGALPSGRGRGWAESPQGIEYAMRQIAAVAKGLQGREAIDSIVRRFERPANPDAEVERAWGSYGSFAGGGEPIGASAVPAPSFPQQSGAPLSDRELAGINATLRNFGGSYKGVPRVTMPTNLPSRAAPQFARPTPVKSGKGDYPLGQRGAIIGVPNQGTHTLYGNWESDNAVDISVPVGTPVYALTDGKIGSQIGALGSGDARLAGLRVHLDGKNDSFYYAHLSRLAVRAGQRVKKGQLIGWSGSANGSAHLHLASRNRDPRSYL